MHEIPKQREMYRLLEDNGVLGRRFYFTEPLTYSHCWDRLRMNSIYGV